VYRRLFDTVLARLDAERAHRLGFAALRVAAPVPGLLRMVGGGRRPWPGGDIEAFGLSFPGPLGIAAGFDKNGVGIDALAAAGFAFVEVGTVTGLAQPGNDRPRLLRLPADRALVNRMGFNNDGAAVIGARLAQRRSRPSARRVVVGVNIGKSRVVPEERAVDDYLLSTRLVAPYADYLVVNVSSPNTPGLRGLQAIDVLGPLLTAVRRQAGEVAERHVPLLVKIAPDLTDEGVGAIALLAADLGLDGVVAVNTTVTRTGLSTPIAEVAAAGTGGLSGPPLRARSLDVLRLLRRHAPDLPVISVGGVTTAADVAERLAAGAVLVQAYTAFVYEGPAWPRRVQRHSARLQG
jgi:dihydroorotate dehydrogenase